MVEKTSNYIFMIIINVSVSLLICHDQIVPVKHCWHILKAICR